MIDEESGTENAAATRLVHGVRYIIRDVTNFDLDLDIIWELVATVTIAGIAIISNTPCGSSPSLPRSFAVSRGRCNEVEVVDICSGHM